MTKEDSSIDRRCRLALVEAKGAAAQIVDGTISPEDGARKIGSELGGCYNFLGQDDLVDLLGAFSGYADLYQEKVLNPFEKQAIDSDVLKSAREFTELAAGRELG